MKSEGQMYVRTKEGYIGKSIYITEYNVNIDNKKICEIENIIKGSHNIIDLIEEGDYVNGYEVCYIDKECKKVICCFATFNEEDIETIVTKEQFESMQYEVKNND